MGYPTTVTYNGITYEGELDYQFNYLYALGEVDYIILFEDMGIELDDNEEIDPDELDIDQEIPADEVQIDD
jgi:hypothetical protein